MKKFKWGKHPIPLAYTNDALLDYKPRFAIDISNPIISVDDDFLVLKNSFAIIRNLFLIPALIYVLFQCKTEVDNIYTEWKVSETDAIDLIASVKAQYGDDYFDTIPKYEKRKGTEVYRYIIINNEGRLTFDRFLMERYRGKSFGWENYYSRHDINSIIFFGTTIPILLIWVIRFKRRAPLIFDRKRRLLYTWSKGDVVAQRYDNLRVLETSSFLAIMLRAPVKKGKLGWGRFSVSPQGNTIYNSHESYQSILAYIVQFMEYGREHVMPEQTQWQGRKGWFFFEDKKPKDFEEQLTALLVRIDAAKDEVEFDEHGQLVES